MCGIVGVLDTSGRTKTADVEKMSDCLSHRGPDDSGLYQDVENGTFLAHRRLSLIDLSETGHQPMEADGLVIVYNGEIYNYQEIRLKLEEEGVVFTGDSDTEVLLRGWKKWGSEIIGKCRGMFAFAILNKDTQELYICRDRFGVKPLYYFYDEERFIFASELKALMLHPAVAKEIDVDAVGLFLQLGYVPAPYSIYKNIYKLEPAHRLYIRSTMEVVKERYWSLRDWQKQNDTTRESEVLSNLESKLKESCALRMVADVPVGVFLSGGIDSSLVTALLVERGYKNVATFTIGFAESSHNEATHAKAVAKHLGTEHHEYVCTTKEAQEIIPKLPSMYDEPFADASAIPTYLLSRFSKQYVTAALSADGGDELFGGYARYRSTENIYQKFARIPSGLGLLVKLSTAALCQLSKLGILPQHYAHKFAKANLFYQTKSDLLATYAIKNSYFSDTDIDILLLATSQKKVRDVYEQFVPSGIKNIIRKLQFIDAHSYLPDDILAKVDRASMAVSLEAREPLLDHTLWEQVAQISDEHMSYDKGAKYLLRQILHKYVPREMVDRPKQGFGVPLDDWLRTDLRYLLDEYLSEDAVKSSGVLNVAAVHKEKDDFLSGRQPYNRVWNLLVLQMWLSYVNL